MAVASCKVCDRGVLERKKMHRMSGPAVVIGYILLIPSICGILFCAIGYLNLLLSPNAREIAKTEARSSMQRAGVGSEAIESVLSDPTFVPQKELGGSEGDAAIAAQNKLVSVNWNTADPEAMTTAKRIAYQTMEDNGVRSFVIQKVLTDPQYDADDDMNRISMAELSWVHEAQGTLRKAASDSPGSGVGRSQGAQVAQGLFVILGIYSFVGGIFGWLLVMKKHVLLCNYCSATVSAA